MEAARLAFRDFSVVSGLSLRVLRDGFSPFGRHGGDVLRLAL
jgi:hypothetical protein